MEVLAALEQRESGMRLSDVAKTLDVQVSSSQAALRLLIRDRFVVFDASRRTYQSASDTDVARLLDVAAPRLPGPRLVDVALRASPAVEFAGRDGDGLLIVTRWDAEPRDEVRLGRMLRRLPDGTTVERLSHDQARERLLVSSSLRERATRSRIVAGTVARTFPDPFRHGSPEAPLLGTAHPALRRPSDRALRRIARRFGLREILVFGSAVHADFRPDSDVDVMVRRQPGIERTLEDELALRRDLEDLFDRDVDVVDAAVLRPEVRSRAEAEGVVLYG